MTTPALDIQDLERRVKDVYREVALRPERTYHFEMGRPLAERLGYPSDVLDQVPAAALASFAGVGYYLDLAAPAAGDRVLDLGSGSGTDSFALAHLVGPDGHVTGLDMTDEQLTKAERLRTEFGRNNVEFVRGYIQDPPIADGSVDLVVSNGVINLAPDKAAVFAEAARLLRPGGTYAIVGFHPHFIMASGMPTHFDDADGEPVAIVTHVHQLSDQVAAAHAAGFRLAELRERLVDDAWVVLKPKWDAMRGHPVAFAAVWRS